MPLDVNFVKQTPVKSELPVNEPEKEKEPTKEELSALADAAMKALGFDDRPKASTKAPPSPAPKETPATDNPDGKKKDATDPAPSPEPAPVASAPAVTPQPEVKIAPVVDPNAIADAVADRLKPKQDAQVSNDTVAEPSSDEDAHTKAVVAVMAERPGNAHLVNELEAFYGKEKQYKAAWEKGNPGKKFDPESTDHAEFYDKNEVKFDDKEWDRAEAKLEARTEVRREFERKQQAEKDEQNFRNTETAANTTVKGAVKEMVQAALPEVKDFDGDFNKLAEDDPFAARVLSENAQALDTLITESHRLFTPELRTRPDLNNPVHKVLLHNVYNYENEIAAQPADKQVQNGRKFARLEDFARMSLADQKRHWTLWSQPKEVSDRLKRDFSKNATEQITQYRQDFEKLATKRGFAKGQPASQTTPDAGSTIVSKPAPSASKTTPPNTSGAADVVTTDPNTTKAGGKFADDIDRALFG